MGRSTVVEGDGRQAFESPPHPQAARRDAGPSGGMGVMGGKSLMPGVLLAAGIVVAATVVNVLTGHADHPEAARWKAWAIEGTSGAMLLAVSWIPGFAVAWAETRKGWAHALVAHGAAVASFSVLHVSGMVALRLAIYAAAGAAYVPGLWGQRLAYEFPKDLLAYALFAMVFWLLRLRAAQTVDDGDAHIHIRDGARMFRVLYQDILAVASAGNYVEFILRDGRRLLMRATLAGVETRLASFGFVRTHRSWLVNRRNLTAVAPTGSGDWQLTLGDLRVPLSRRFPAALKSLRASG